MYQVPRSIIDLMTQTSEKNHDKAARETSQTFDPFFARPVSDTSAPRNFFSSSDQKKDMQCDEPGGWPNGTMSYVKSKLPQISDERLVKEMTSLNLAAGLDGLVGNCSVLPSDIVDLLASQLPEDFPHERIEEVVASFHQKGDPDAILAMLYSEYEQMFECPLCFEKYKMEEMYTVDCDSSHRFCFGCIGRCVSVAIKDGGRVFCPGEGCNYELSYDEIMQLSRIPKCGLKKEEINKYDNQSLMRCVQSIPGIIGCPTEGCANWIIPSTIMEKERCNCDACGACFCSLCRRQFHYDSLCSDIPRIHHQWLEWTTNGRAKYNKDKTEAMERINAAKAEIEKRNKEMMDRYNELVADEDYKAKNGRLCPRCGRIIFKLDGCDAMVCGRDCHGGNVQNGCGFHFSWSSARPYVSDVVKPEEKKFEMEIPEIAREYVHVGVACDICHQEIKGLRFRCINCPDCDFCERCEIQGTMAHDKNHVFEIMTKERYQQQEEQQD